MISSRNGESIHEGNGKTGQSPGQQARCQIDSSNRGSQSRKIFSKAIVVPVRNQNHLLLGFLTNLKTDKAFRRIVVDDGGIDPQATAAIASSMGYEYIRHDGPEHGFEVAAQFGFSFCDDCEYMEAHRIG